MFEKRFVMPLLCLVVALSLSATATRGANILFVSSMTAVEDDALKAFMEGLGHTVTYIDDDEDEATTEAAAAAADLVFVSESVGSGGIKNEITEIEVPMIVGEPWAWDEMGLTEGSGGDDPAVTTDVEIVDPEHYLAAGLSGTVAVFTEILAGCNLGKGITGPEATVIATATLSDTVTYDVIFVYEKGAALPVAPADGSAQVAADIRIGFGFHANCYPVLSENAYVLLGAAVDYALGLTEPPEPVDPGTDGLVAHYAFENDVNDSSVNALHGTMVGDPVFVEGLADYGMALDLDGIDDVVELGKFDVVGQITLAVWIKADDFEINDARILSKAKEWGGNDHWWMLSTISETSLRFRLKTDDGQDTATLISDPVLEAGVWAHVAVTWDGAMMRIYKDGVEVAGQEKGGTAVAVDPNISVAIGSQPSDAFASDPGHVAKFFDGLVDEAQIYERALSDGEILYLAGERVPVDPGTENLMAYYPLDNDANDASANNNHGTLSGDPQWVLGAIGEALEFDGIDDHVDCGNDPSLDITGPITIGAWVYPTGSGSSNYPRIVDKSDGTGGADPGYKMYLRSADNYLVTLSAGGVYLNSSISATLDDWNYVAFVTDGTHRKLYLNGVWEVWDEIALPVSSSNPLFLGDSPAGSRPLNGIIDEVTIYNRALSEPEVRFIAGER